MVERKRGTQKKEPIEITGHPKFPQLDDPVDESAFEIFRKKVSNALKKMKKKAA